jgi:hypothetical protein
MLLAPSSHVLLCLTQFTWYNGISNMVSLITKTKLRLSALPILDGTATHRTKHGHTMLHQQMERPKDQRPLHLYAIGKPIHTGKGGRRPCPRPPFLSFSFIFSPFHLFTTNVTRALPLETIKGEAGATSKRETSQRRHTHLTETSWRRHTYLTKTTPHTQLPRRDLGSVPSLESL